MRRRILVVLAAASLLAGLGCGKSPCPPVPLTGEWSPLPFTAFKEGVVCHSDKDHVMVWRKGDVATNVALATGEMEAAGYRKMKQDIGTNHRYTYKKGGAVYEVEIYDFEGTGMLVKRGK